MVMHLQKLCVGVDSPESLQERIDYRAEQARLKGNPYEQFHTTRATPKERDAILQGGSLYWIIKGAMQARQTIIDLRTKVCEDGITRCDIVLEPLVIRTERRPRRPFQGWRYLKPDDVPKDLTGCHADEDEMPIEMRTELLELGLL